MAKANSEVNGELAVMKRFSTALARMSPAARRRVVSWLAGQIEEMGAAEPGPAPTKQVGMFDEGQPS